MQFCNFYCFSWITHFWNSLSFFANQHVYASVLYHLLTHHLMDFGWLQNISWSNTVFSDFLLYSQPLNFTFNWYTNWQLFLFTYSKQIIPFLWKCYFDNLSFLSKNCLIFYLHMNYSIFAFFLDVLLKIYFRKNYR